MLSEQSTPIIRATRPLVGAAIDDIAANFYDRLFRDRPELLRDLFNRGNQANGEQRRALAGSIVAFAGTLLGDEPDRAAMIGRIAGKHASVGITPDQYKIVHEHLFAAIGEVLGDAVTDEVSAAWDEVYWSMADALIAVEATLYREAGVSPGAAWRPMRVVERRTEAVDAVSLLLVPADGGEAGTFLPGQYVSVRIGLPDGARQIRQYSLSSAPGLDTWRITVKLARGGPGPDGEVSARLHAVDVGDVLPVSPPFGDLVAPDDGPLVLASAGIGVTPMTSILDSLRRGDPDRPVTVVHADGSPSRHPHRDEQRRLVDAMPNASLHLFYEDLDGADDAEPGRVDLDRVPVPDGATALLCGPSPFMREVRDGLLRRGVPAERIRYEVFGPDMWLAR